MIHLPKLTLALLALTLSACSTLTDVYERQDALLAPKPLNAANKTPAAVTTYRAILKAAENAYEADAKKQTPTPAVLIDAGIAAANANCRAWFAAVSDADRRWSQGEGNSTRAERDYVDSRGGQRTVQPHHRYGVAATAWSGFNQNFHSSVLNLGQHDIQSAVKNVMVQRANELRAQAPGMTFPQAADALDDYSRNMYRADGAGDYQERAECDADHGRSGWRAEKRGEVNPCSRPLSSLLRARPPQRRRAVHRHLRNPYYRAGAVVARLAVNGATLIWALVVLAKDDALAVSSYGKMLTRDIPENVFAVFFAVILAVLICRLIRKSKPNPLGIIG